MVDPFGAMLAAHLSGRPSPGRIERDDGWVEEEADGAATWFDGPSRWPAAVRTALARLASTSGPVLDVGAGAGRHAVWLQERGVPVVAIDPSPGAVAVMRERGVRDVRRRSLDEVGALPERFGAVLLLGNNLGLLGTPADAPGHLATLAAVTRPDAVVLGETVDPRDTTDPVHLAHRERNRRAGNLPGQLRLRSHFDGVAGDWFDYLLLSPDDLRGLLAGTPWVLAEVATSPGTPTLVVTLVRRAGVAGPDPGSDPGSNSEPDSELGPGPT